MKQERLSEGLFGTMHLRNFEGTEKTQLFRRVMFLCTSPFLCITFQTKSTPIVRWVELSHFFACSLTGLDALPFLVRGMFERYSIL